MMLKSTIYLNGTQRTYLVSELAKQANKRD